jgi:CSLREA domain-containing protein
MACAVVGLALPALAAAATQFEVNSTADEEDDNPGAGGCHTAAGKCTLRAAIEEANEITSEASTIVFAPAFDGQAADTITLGSSLPLITSKVTINGIANGAASGKCTTQAGPTGPCVGVSGPAGNPAFEVEGTEVTIKGLAITAAGTGIEASSEGAGFLVTENWIGTKLDGTASANGIGIELVEMSAPNPFQPKILSNQIRGGGGAAVLLDASEAIVEGNKIAGGANGVRTIHGETGSRISGNTIEGATGAGVLLESDSNVVVGNQILGSGAAGVRVHSPGSLVGATENTIGGGLFTSTDPDTNLISNSTGPAVELNTVEKFGGEPVANRVLRNTGSGNTGLFIDLVTPGAESKGTNLGIKPPVIGSATKAKVSGTAEPEAFVRIFSKASTATGELGSFLGFAIAEPDGTWILEYDTPIAGGTVIGATQTASENEEEARSSELAVATTPSDPPPPSCATDVSLCPPTPTPTPNPTPTPKPQPKPLTCKKGFKKKKVKGKTKCVKVKKKAKHH